MCLPHVGRLTESASQGRRLRTPILVVVRRFALLLPVILLVACEPGRIGTIADKFEPGPTPDHDAGPRDGGTVEVDRDSGPVTARDGGPNTARDAGEGVDAGEARDAGTPMGRDAGTYDAGPRPTHPRDGGPGGASGPLSAFPGAEGYGTETPGGRGGDVMIVTTLNWGGAGSFSEALYTPRPRTIVFEVSGVIDAPDAAPALGPQHSFLTIAGQTSPGGITFRGTGVGGSTIYSYQPTAPESGQLRDVVIRFARFRGRGNSDNITVAGVRRFVFDHCDFSGADDEALDVTYAQDVTVSWSTVTNSGPGSHYGFLFAYHPTTRISYHHNLSANHFNRCGFNAHWGEGGPPAAGADLDVRNNVLHNCGNETFFHYWDEPTWPLNTIRANFIGNTFSSGPNTHTGWVAIFGTNSGVTVHESDNDYPGYPTFPGWASPRLQNNPLPMSPVTTYPRTEARDRVLAHAGAWPRDAMNVRTINQVLTGGGALGQTNDPMITSGPPAPADGDRDGMPDAWETQYGTNPSVFDANDDLDGDGWTNLEEYLADRANELVGVP